MNNWRYYNPVQIVQGLGCLNSLPEYVGSGPTLLLTSPGFVRRGITSRIANMLKSHRIEIYDQVTANPDLEVLETLVRTYRSFFPQQIVALGGGSVIDTGKVLALALPGERENQLRAYCLSAEALDCPGSIPFIAIPTTAGTGAEVTPFATVWDRVKKKKHSIEHGSAYAKTALLDAELTLTLPPSETLYTGLDALSHALESIWNKHRNSVSRLFSVAAIERIVEALPAVLKHNADAQARVRMQQAALFAGLAINCTRTAIAHAISYPLTIHCGVPHGLAASFTLAGILRYCRSKNLMLPIDIVMQNTVLSLLDSLSLSQEINRFAGISDIVALYAEMRNPARSNNFLLDFDEQDLDDLLRISMT